MVKEDKETKDTKRSKKQVIKEETKDFVQDFRSFAFKGNVIDLAVGIIIGAAFNSIVNSLVKDIVQPIIGKIIGNTAFSELYINLSSTTYPTLATAEAAGAPVIRYGIFLNNVMNFFITALTLFIVLRYLLRQKRAEEDKNK